MRVINNWIERLNMRRDCLDWQSNYKKKKDIEIEMKELMTTTIV